MTHQHACGKDMSYKELPTRQNLSKHPSTAVPRVGGGGVENPSARGITESRLRGTFALPRCSSLLEDLLERETLLNTMRLANPAFGYHPLNLVSRDILRITTLQRARIDSPFRYVFIDKAEEKKEKKGSATALYSQGVAPIISSTGSQDLGGGFPFPPATKNRRIS